MSNLFIFTSIKIFWVINKMDLFIMQPKFKVGKIPRLWTFFDSFQKLIRDQSYTEKTKSNKNYLKIKFPHETLVFERHRSPRTIE